MKRPLIGMATFGVFHQNNNNGITPSNQRKLLRSKENILLENVPFFPLSCNYYMEFWIEAILCNINKNLWELCENTTLNYLLFYLKNLKWKMPSILYFLDCFAAYLHTFAQSPQLELILSLVPIMPAICNSLQFSF